MPSAQVGAGKLKVLKGEFVLFKFRQGQERGDIPTFTVDEAQKEQFFNVLYFTPQKFELSRVPLVPELVSTIQETAELLRPVFRFGIPKASILNKCPHHRPRGTADAPSLNVCSAKLQHVIDWSRRRSMRVEPQAQAHTQSHGHVHEPLKHDSRILKQRFYVPELSFWTIFALNFGVFCYLARPPGY